MFISTCCRPCQGTQTRQQLELLSASWAILPTAHSCVMFKGKWMDAPTFNLHMLAQFLHWSLCFRVSILLGVFLSLVKNLGNSNVTSSAKMMRSKPTHPPARFGVVSSIKHSAVFVLSCCITEVLCHICHYRSQVVASVLTVWQLLPDMIQGCPRMAMQNWNSSNSNNSKTRKERRKSI